MKWEVMHGRVHAGLRVKGVRLTDVGLRDI